MEFFQCRAIILRFSFLLAFFDHTLSIPIDNGLTDEPEIICGSDRIRFNFNTENSFEGNIFVKGLFAEEECRNRYSGENSTPFMELPFDKCGVRRERSLNPKGVFVSVSVIISFHPQFITKVDRAYLFSCFYMEAEKTVSASIDVSMLTTEFRTTTVTMPICRYEILSEDANGDPVRYALVGDKVYHRWICDSETVDSFCMTVHSCFVDDTKGMRIMLLTEEGCAVDKYVLGNLEYTSDLEAGKAVHVYKFADNNNLYFDCQIQISVKDPQSPCQRPECNEPTRGKRSALFAHHRSCPNGNCIDVHSQLNTIQATRDRNGRLQPLISDLSEANSSALISDSDSTLHCFSIAHIAAGMSGLTVCCMILSTSIICAMYRWKRRTVVLILTSQQPPRISAQVPQPPPSKPLQNNNTLPIRPPSLKPQIKAKPENRRLKPIPESEPSSRSFIQRF